MAWRRGKECKNSTAGARKAGRKWEGVRKGAKVGRGGKEIKRRWERVGNGGSQ